MILSLPDGVGRVELRIVTAEGVTPVVNVFHLRPDPARSERPAAPFAPRLSLRSPWRRPMIVAGGFAVLTFAALASAAILLPLRQTPAALSSPHKPVALRTAPALDPADLLPPPPPPLLAQEPQAVTMPAMPPALARELARPPVVNPPPRSPPRQAIAPSGASDGQARGGNPFGLE